MVGGSVIPIHDDFSGLAGKKVRHHRCDILADERLSLTTAPLSSIISIKNINPFPFLSGAFS